MRADWRFDDGDLVEHAFDAGTVHRTALLERDGVGRVVAATVDGDRRAYAYAPAGELLAATSAAGAFSFAYDACGRLVHETSPAGTVDYEHDGAAQLTRRRDADGGVREYDYDEAGRRVSERGSDLSRCWEWDELGRLRAIRSRPAGSSEEDTTRVVVDAHGELADVDGEPVLWDSADPLAPLAWLDGQAVIGADAPWAVAAGVYALEGDYANAALSLLAAVPGVGDAAALGKVAMAVALPLAKVAKRADSLPTVAFSRARAPYIAGNFDEAVARGHPTTLTKVEGRSLHRQQRREALRGQPPAPAGHSLDEYPFASTAEGGLGANVRAVPVAEQQFRAASWARSTRSTDCGTGIDSMSDSIRSVLQGLCRP